MESIDLYCERVGPGVWAEPVNAWTNLAFLVAAWASWKLAQAVGVRGTSIRALVALMVIIGIGSALFHTFATTWARLLDVVPILLFQLWFLWLYLRRVLAAGASYSALSVAVFLIAALFGRQFPAVLNGALTYVPALAVLMGLGVAHLRQRRQNRTALLLAAGVFALSLTARRIDHDVCPYVPVGTHFLWHVLNAAVLYLVTKGLVANWRIPQGARPPL